MIGRSSFFGPLGVFLALMLVCTVFSHPDTCCLAVHSLTLVVVVVVWGWALYVCVSLKFEGGTMMVMVPRQYFQLSSCEGPAVQ